MSSPRSPYTKQPMQQLQRLASADRMSNNSSVSVEELAANGRFRPNLFQQKQQVLSGGQDSSHTAEARPPLPATTRGFSPRGPANVFQQPFNFNAGMGHLHERANVPADISDRLSTPVKARTFEIGGSQINTTESRVSSGRMNQQGCPPGPKPLPPITLGSKLPTSLISSIEPKVLIPVLNQGPPRQEMLSNRTIQSNSNLSPSNIAMPSFGDELTPRPSGNRPNPRATVPAIDEVRPLGSVTSGAEVKTQKKYPSFEPPIYILSDAEIEELLKGRRKEVFRMRKNSAPTRMGRNSLLSDLELPKFGTRGEIFTKPVDRLVGENKRIWPSPPKSSNDVVVSFCDPNSAFSTAPGRASSGSNQFNMAQSVSQFVTQPARYTGLPSQESFGVQPTVLPPLVHNFPNQENHILNDNQRHTTMYRSSSTPATINRTSGQLAVMMNNIDTRRLPDLQQAPIPDPNNHIYSFAEKNLVHGAAVPTLEQLTSGRLSGGNVIRINSRQSQDQVTTQNPFKAVVSREPSQNFGLPPPPSRVSQQQNIVVIDRTSATNIRPSGTVTLASSTVQLPNVQIMSRPLESTQNMPPQTRTTGGDGEMITFQSLLPTQFENSGSKSTPKVALPQPGAPQVTGGPLPWTPQQQPIYNGHIPVVFIDNHKPSLSTPINHMQSPLPTAIRSIEGSPLGQRFTNEGLQIPRPQLETSVIMGKVVQTIETGNAATRPALVTTQMQPLPVNFQQTSRPNPVLPVTMRSPNTPIDKPTIVQAAIISPQQVPSTSDGAVFRPVGSQSTLAIPTRIIPHNTLRDSHLITPEMIKEKEHEQRAIDRRNNFKSSRSNSRPNLAQQASIPLREQTNSPSSTGIYRFGITADPQTTINTIKLGHQVHSPSIPLQEAMDNLTTQRSKPSGGFQHSDKNLFTSMLDDHTRITQQTMTQRSAFLNQEVIPAVFVVPRLPTHQAFKLASSYRQLDFVILSPITILPKNTISVGIQTSWAPSERRSIDELLPLKARYEALVNENLRFQDLDIELNRLKTYEAAYYTLKSREDHVSSQFGRQQWLEQEVTRLYTTMSPSGFQDNNSSLAAPQNNFQVAGGQSFANDLFTYSNAPQESQMVKEASYHQNQGVFQQTGTSQPLVSFVDFGIAQQQQNPYNQQTDRSNTFVPQNQNDGYHVQSSVSPQMASHMSYPQPSQHQLHQDSYQHSVSVLQFGQQPPQVSGVSGDLLSQFTMGSQQAHLVGGVQQSVLPNTVQQQKSNLHIEQNSPKNLEVQLQQLQTTQSNILSRIGMLASSPLISRPLNINLLRELDERVNDGQRRVESLKLEEQRMIGVIEGLRERLKEERKKYINRENEDKRGKKVDHQKNELTEVPIFGTRNTVVEQIPSNLNSSRGPINNGPSGLISGTGEHEISLGPLGGTQFQRDSEPLRDNYFQALREPFESDNSVFRTEKKYAPFAQAIQESDTNNILAKHVSPKKAESTQTDKSAVKDNFTKPAVSTIEVAEDKQEVRGLFGMTYGSMISGNEPNTQAYHPRTGSIQDPPETNLAEQVENLFPPSPEKTPTGVNTGPLVFTSQLENLESAINQGQRVSEVPAVLQSEFVSSPNHIDRGQNGNPARYSVLAPSINSELDDTLGARKIVTRFGTIVPQKEQEEISKLKEKVEQLIEENKKLLNLQAPKQIESFSKKSDMEYAQSGPGMAGMSLNQVAHPLGNQTGFPTTKENAMATSAAFPEMKNQGMTKDISNKNQTPVGYRAIDYLGDRPSLVNQMSFGFVNIHDKKSPKVQAEEKPSDEVQVATDPKEYTSIYSFQPSQDMISALTNYVNTMDQAKQAGGMTQMSVGGETNAALRGSQGPIIHDPSQKDSQHTPPGSRAADPKAADNSPSSNLLRIPMRRVPSRKRHLSEGTIDAKEFQEDANAGENPTIQDEDEEAKAINSLREKEIESKSLRKILEDIAQRQSFKSIGSMEKLSKQLQQEESEIKQLRLRILDVLRLEQNNNQAQEDGEVHYLAEHGHDEEVEYDEEGRPVEYREGHEGDHTYGDNEYGEEYNANEQQNQDGEYAEMMYESIGFKNHASDYKTRPQACSHNKTQPKSASKEYSSANKPHPGRSASTRHPDRTTPSLMKQTTSPTLLKETTGLSVATREDQRHRGKNEGREDSKSVRLLGRLKVIEDMRSIYTKHITDILTSAEKGQQ